MDTERRPNTPLPLSTPGALPARRRWRTGHHSAGIPDFSILHRAGRIRTCLSSGAHSRQRAGAVRPRTVKYNLDIQLTLTKLDGVIYHTFRLLGNNGSGVTRSGLLCRIFLSAVLQQIISAMHNASYGITIIDKLYYVRSSPNAYLTASDTCLPSQLLSGHRSQSISYLCVQ